MLDPGLLSDLVDAMFAADARGRLLGSAPQLHVVRTRDTVICRCHADVPESVARRLQEISARPRPRPSRWEDDYGAYLAGLAALGPLTAMRAGPLYHLANPPPELGGAICIEAGDSDLLDGGLEAWRSDLAGGALMAAMVVDGRAVAVCASAHSSTRAHCAGVETLPSYRGRGFAARATAGWARLVLAAGAAPFYATTFDNIASQGVARRLGLAPVGAEFSVRCRLG